MATAAALGHEYCALTDHSPRLTIANGLSPDRLRKQLDVIDGLREQCAPMRILTGIEVDILDDGGLDQEPGLLERLDVVVASVHSKLSMDSAAMTRRMVRAVSAPRRRRARPLHRPAGLRKPRYPARVEIRRRGGVHRVPRPRHGRRDQLPPRAPRPADPAAEPGSGDRLRLQHRHGRARPGSTRLPRLRRPARVGRRRPRRPDREHLAGRPAVGVDGLELRRAVSRVSAAPPVPRRGLAAGGANAILARGGGFLR